VFSEKINKPGQCLWGHKKTNNVHPFGKFPNLAFPNLAVTRVTKFNPGSQTWYYLLQKLTASSFELYLAVIKKRVVWKII